MRPALPDALRPLLELAYNLRWTYNAPIRALFRDLDQVLWETTGRNPAALLRRIERRRLQEAAQDAGYVARVHALARDFHAHLSLPSWFDTHQPRGAHLRVAYFAAEFGLTDCVPLYSGGLGILSGDHLKSASELGIPLTGVGLLYRHGYFTQRISGAGRQLESYPRTHIEDLPAQRELAPDGRTVTIRLEFPGREVHAEVWRIQVGRIHLLLLDTGIEANRPEDQVITGALYAGDRETRLQQEIVLGIGGLRALLAVGQRPNVCHMNEGHAAFLVLERLRQLVRDEGLPLRDAQDAIRAENVFTTHTPVPAGFDAFSPELMRPYFESYAAELGLGWGDFLALGGSDGGSPFSMAVLALNHSGTCNAVSPLHRDVSRALFRSFHPPQHEAAERLEFVSNGIHNRSWVSLEMKALLTRHLGDRWLREPQEPSAWEGLDAVPDAELWGVHADCRARLVEWVRQRLPQQLERRGVEPQEHAWARQVLDPQALTIGWARRFAGYKRATLLLRDVERLRRLLLGDPARPVQVVIAGKAHPHDDEGKRMIEDLARFAADAGVRARVVLLANYDIDVARVLVQGVDVWLNTPRRPLEASGTSGMKVIANGGLHLSVLDGWWAEAYAPDLGWALGGTDGFEDPGHHDHVEAGALYEILEREVVPLFFERDSRGIPAAWVARMRTSMRRLCPYYNTHRMVREYTERFYLPALLPERGLPSPAAGSLVSGPATP
ncbi:MAG: alpha-glucan family phosphorylase [Gemmatimonadetes bacterium]|nr:alpha-glucan family phosphorylase [Gemmatimonadota bacterium]